jgi:O-antigen ligase
MLALAWVLARLPLMLGSALCLGGLFLVVSLIHPHLALLALPFAVPFGSLVEFPIGIMRVGATEAAVLWALMTWLISFSIHRHRSLAWPSITLPFWVFALAMLASATQSLSLQYTVKELLKWAEMFLAALLTLNLLRAVDSPRWLARALVAALLLAGSLSALQGIAQFVGRIGPPGFVLFGRFMRAHGTFQQPNPFGGYMGLTLPIAFALSWHSLTQRGRTPPLLSALYVGAAGVTGLALLMSWSRGAWMGAAAALAAVTALRSRRAALGFAVVSLIVAVLVMTGAAARLPDALTERFGGLTSYLQVADVSGIEPNPSNWAVVERLAHWQAAWGMFSDNPWLGVGFGNYEPVYPAYALPRWADPLGHAHNYYLNILAEAGLLGLFAYLLFWGSSVLLTWRTIRRSHGERQALALGILGVMAYLGVHSLFDNLYVHGMPIHLGVLLGMTAWCAGEGGKDGSSGLTD